MTCFFTVGRSHLSINHASVGLGFTWNKSQRENKSRNKSLVLVLLLANVNTAYKKEPQVLAKTEYQI